MEKWIKRFKICSLITLSNIYLVILAGGVVRCTGSGMGCPDWPKCFGLWIPPTHISQLPENYVELYSEGGHLTVEFNVYKTWTEYINRLLGAVAGVAVFITLLYSIPLRKRTIWLVYGSVLAFVLMGFQGWLGAKVVATNLKPVMITIHMFFALVISSVLIWLYRLACYNDKINIAENHPTKSIKTLTIVGITITLIQTLLGTQVRQQLEILAHSGMPKSLWVENIGIIIPIHIATAYLLIGFTIYFTWKTYAFQWTRKWSVSLVVLLFVEYIGGVILYKFGLPAWVQPIHLLAATCAYGLYFYQFVLVSTIHHASKTSSN